MENKTIKVEIEALTIPKAQKGMFLQKANRQKIHFISDKYTKGKPVAMVLTSEFGAINLPDHEIYIDQDNLQKALEFIKNI